MLIKPNWRPGAALGMDAYRLAFNDSKHLITSFSYIEAYWSMFQLLWGSGHVYLRRNWPFRKAPLLEKPCFKGGLFT